MNDLLSGIFKEFQVTTERIIRELAYSAFYNPTNCFHNDGKLKNLDEIPEPAQRSIASLAVSETEDDDGRRVISKKITFNSKLKALETLARIRRLMDPPNSANTEAQPIKLEITYVK